MGPDEMHPKILEYLWWNESFIKAISKLFEKRIEYEMVLSIREIAIVITQHKKGFDTFKN